MSVPSLEFGKLDLEDMAETRSQARQRGPRGGRGGRGRGRGRGGGPSTAESQVPPTPTTPLAAHMRFTYNGRGFTEQQRVRAEKGFSSAFIVETLEPKIDHRRGRYYALQIKKPVALRIYAPGTDGTPITCSCEDHTLCKHIFWLFDTLNVAFGRREQFSERELNAAQVLTELGEMYGEVGPNLRTLPNTLNAMRADDLDDSSDSEEEDTEELYISSNSDARKFEVRDMLSAFDPEHLPQNYGSDFVTLEPADAINERLFRPANLAESIYNLAVQKNTFYKELRKVLSPNLCADMSFTKHNVRVQRIVQSLDEYIRDGPTGVPGRRDMTIVECAFQLRRIAAALFRERTGRLNQHPLAYEALVKVPNTFLRILRDVLTHNQDIHRSSLTWSRKIPMDPHQSARERNLFLYLIGDPPATQLSEFFIVDYLAQMPREEWAHLEEELAEVTATARRVGAEKGFAHALAWADRLDELLEDLSEDTAVMGAGPGPGMGVGTGVGQPVVVESVETEGPAPFSFALPPGAESSARGSGRARNEGQGRRPMAEEGEREARRRRLG